MASALTPENVILRYIKMGVNCYPVQSMIHQDLTRPLDQAPVDHPGWHARSSRPEFCAARARS
jgi:hypothetical protein